MPSTKISTYTASDAITEPKIGQLENEGHDSLDNFIRQAIGKEPIFSFTRSGESPIQWIQLLHALDQQGNGKASKGSLTDNMVEDNDHQQEHCNGISTISSKINGFRKTGNSTKGCGAPAEMTKSSSEHIQTLKIPEAVVAIAQAAAKANGEPEKYLPGWPLLSPSKVRLLKCDKCPREFCSPINYRRHIRVHRRSLNVDKVSPKTKELLGAFWDKLSLDEAKQLASLEDVKLEAVTGSSITGALTSLLRKPGLSSLPQAYIKAGATLLDIVQGRPSRLPVSAKELFNILDDASEKTFLCAGTAISLQRFVFDGEVGKIAMEMKNLIACTSFLLEQKLVRAWLAEKDAEALRCQKLLFEEEEAAQKRQAELLERKRMKKQRQKEQKTKQHLDVNKPGAEDGSSDTAESASCSMETESSMQLSELSLSTTGSPVHSCDSALEANHSLNPCMVADETCRLATGDADRNWEYQFQKGNTQRLPTLPHRLILKPTRNFLNGLHSHVSITKPIAMQKHNGSRDQKSASLTNNQKVWTRKSKPQDDVEDCKHKEREKEMGDRSDGRARCAVLIGSISVDLKSRDVIHDSVLPTGQMSVKEEGVEFDSTLSSVDEPKESWKQVDDEEVGVSGSFESKRKEAVIGVSCSEAASRILQDQSCLPNGGMSDCMSEMSANSFRVAESADFSSPKLFSSKVAMAFLSQRWKAAISADHVQLVLSPETEAKSKGDAETRGYSQMVVEPQSLDRPRCSILGSTENQIAGMRSVEPSSSIIYKPKIPKPENGYRLKYIPKQRNNV